MTTLTRPVTTPAPPTLGHRLVRGLGWTFIALGGVMLLYLVWLLWFTGLGTEGDQRDLLEEFPGFGDAEVGDSLIGDVDDPNLEGADIVTAGGSVGVIEFERPDESRAPVNADPLAVVAGTSPDALRRGPGHYTETADPGQEGNFVVVGHRTTYGAPFYDIDEILPGDLVHVTTPAGARFTYRIMEGNSDVSAGVRIIGKSELWVLNRDPLGMGGGKYITLISCHPRFSSAQRIVAFGELVE